MVYQIKISLPEDENRLFIIILKTGSNNKRKKFVSSAGMFSFHRPKVYRSSMGCCICKAKSSSSRFTDSKKYEEDFFECFKLSTPRQGEICNACVLLVKRWKKLPAGSDRNWQHVVDARAGPGIKSVAKYKSKHKKQSDEKTDKIKKHFEREYSPILSDQSDGTEEIELPESEFFLEAGHSARSSTTTSPGGSDCEEGVEKKRRHKASPEHKDSDHQISDFVDLRYWKREAVCCGIIFRGLHNEIMIDPTFMKPCRYRIAQCKLQFREKKSDTEISDNVLPKVYSDNSSDSGYDDSSNQEMSSNSSFKKHKVGIEAKTGTKID